MSRQEELEKAIAKVLVATSMTIDLEHKRMPTPMEFSKEVVRFLYGMADHDNEVDKNRIIT